MKIHPLLVTAATVAGLSAGVAPAQDPFVKNQRTTGDGAAVQSLRSLSVCYETFSVPLPVAAKMRRGGKSESELYSWLASESGKNEIRQESFDMLRCMPGQKAKTEAVSEEIYPTRFIAPDSSGKGGGAGTPAKAGDAPAPLPSLAGGVPAPALPTSFYTHYSGRTLDIEANLGGSPASPLIDLHVTPDISALEGRDSWGEGLSTTQMPRFEIQRLNTQVTVALDSPVLLGTLSRPPVSQADPNSANRVWFAFVTVKAVRP